MDVVDIGEFYNSRLGVIARQSIMHALSPKLLATKGANVLGVGYTLPYLGMIKEAQRVLAFMIARQGVIHYPAQGPVQSALVDELDLPLAESSVDFALIVHGLELTDDPALMLAEIWRVLAPHGRLLLLVPNRRGLWASSDTTPFGYGQPFSCGQLGQLLRGARFSPVAWHGLLYLPPFDKRPVIAAAGFLEKFGHYLTTRLSGIILVEAVKQVYAISTAGRAKRLTPRLRPILLPAPLP